MKRVPNLERVSYFAIVDGGSFFSLIFSQTCVFFFGQSQLLIFRFLAVIIHMTFILDGTGTKMRYPSEGK